MSVKTKSNSVFYSFYSLSSLCCQNEISVPLFSNMIHLVSFGIVVVIWIKMRICQNVFFFLLWVYWMSSGGSCFNWITTLKVFNQLENGEECCTHSGLIGTYRNLTGWFPDFNGLFPHLVNITVIIPHAITFSSFFGLHSPFTLPYFGQRAKAKAYSLF